MNVLGIDPGLSATGIATRFAGMWTARTIRTKALTFPEKVQEICASVPSSPWDVVVVEFQAAYSDKPENHQALLRLALLAGALANAAGATRLLLPLPGTWKGQTPKTIHHRRIRARVPGLGRQSKDALDAVGLALYGIDNA